MINLKDPYSRFIAYLKGQLSNRYRHDFEKEMMRDEFTEEAFDGLKTLPVEELENDILQLRQNIMTRISKERNLPAFFVFKIAASILILVGLILAIKFSIKQKNNLPVTEKLAVQKELPVVQNQNEKSIKTFDTLIKSKVVTESYSNLAYTETQTSAEREPKIQIQNEMEPIMQPASSSEVKSEAVMRKAVSEKSESRSKQVVKGKITDPQGTPLTGVNVIEKGTSNGTVSDVEGEFELKVSDKNEILEFSYLGYEPLELKTDTVINYDIVLNEDLLALDEVVVIGYGVQKKSDMTGAVSSVRIDDISPESQSGIIQIEPVPPTGSYSSLKKYIYKNLDYNLLKNLTGNYKVVVEFMVYRDGSTGNFSFKQPVDPGISSEVKRLILNSGKWQPGLLGDQKTDSKVKLRLNLEFDNPDNKKP